MLKNSVDVDSKLSFNIHHQDLSWEGSHQSTRDLDEVSERGVKEGLLRPIQALV